MKSNKNNFLKFRIMNNPLSLFLSGFLVFISFTAFPQIQIDTIGFDADSIYEFCGFNLTDTIPPSHPPGTAPSSAVVNCGGIFILEFEDIAHATGFGFDDPTFGPDRISCACAAFNYIESVIDLSGVTDQIEITFGQSTNLPGSPSLGSASPFPQGLPTTPGFYGGMFYDHVQQGSDPDPGEYDGWIQINFGKQFLNDCSLSLDIDCALPNGCVYDLRSVILHEATHVLGIASLLNFTTVIESAAGPGIFTRYDEIFLYWLNGGIYYKIVDQFGNIDATVQAAGITALTNNNVWLDNSSACSNQPIDSRSPFAFGRSISHFDESYLFRTQFSPMFSPNYLMSSSLPKVRMKRQYTLQEIRLLQTFGYTIDPTFPDFAIINNSPPCINKFIIAPNISNDTYPNTIAPDFVIDNCGTVIIDLSLDAAITDSDGDPIFVFPGSLYNIRGCGTGGNNHNQLTLTTGAGGDIITFIPRQNFIGRAQFGFHLDDGNERGAFIIYTIDVNKNATCFNNGNEYIINGDFEEGTEVKNCVTPNVENSIFGGNYLRGFHFSDGQELRGIFWQDNIIRQSFNSCLFGINWASFQPGTFPNSSINGGDRYVHQIGNSADKFNMTLGEEVLPCNQYILSFEINFDSPFNTSNILNINFGFSNSLISTAPLNDAIQLTINEPIGGGWLSVISTFIYNGTVPSQYIQIVPLTSGSFLIDNLSLILDNSFTPPISVDAGTDVTICASFNTQLNATVTGGVGTISYSWSPTTGLSNPNISNPVATPLTTTTYAVTVTDANGCMAKDYITVTVNDPPIALITSSTDETCSGGCDGQATVSVSGGLSPFTFLWDDPNAQNTSTATGLCAGTFNVTVTDANGCTASTGATINDPGIVCNCDGLMWFGGGFGFDSLSPCGNIILGSPCPGFEYTYFIKFFNNGNEPYQAGTIFEVQLDATMTFLNSPFNDCGATLISTNPLRFEITSPNQLQPGVICTIQITVFVNSIPFGGWNTNLQVSAICSQGTSVFIGNFIQQDECSCDPNDKGVSPAGCGNPGFITNQELTYTIRFQNVGVGPAHNIVLKDTLDSDLDTNTFQILASSHIITSTEILQFNNNNVVVISFDSIELPALQDDTTGSLGFVIYSIKPNLGLPDGTTIVNSTGIIFNGNIPVITNTVVNTIVSSPVPTVDAGIDQTVFFGYPPEECTNLTAIATGALPPYNFIWSDGETTQTITVCPEDTTTFTVVADASGCLSSEDSVIINVLDVRSGQNLNKVLVCHIPPGDPDNAHTISISPNAVPAHLTLHGDHLGPCVDSSFNDSLNLKVQSLNVYLTSYPNPFSQKTIIIISLPESGNINLEFSSLNSPEVVQLYEGYIEANTLYFVEFDGSNLSNGIYFYRLITTTGTYTKKLVVIK